MGIGVAILLIAVGAILTFAVHVTATGFSLHTIGIILMVVGGLGFLAALLLGGVGSWDGVRRRTTVVQDTQDPYVDPTAPAAPRRRTYRRDTYR